jgi:bifunctional non-homologous end joining protein LigD
MTLDQYRRRRDFTTSPEPAGEVRSSADGRRFFCVQKHLASHLHYDLRLEHGGVLLSWAVPKGPSLDPTVRRLAMHVEDHPLDYGTFEGVIPEGYGAGIVLLWDQGTWEPEIGDVDAALRKGDLKFRLNGYKLKGSWALVRTPRTGERSWLLIKHRDDWAGPVDVTQFGISVKSGGEFADILAREEPDVWESNRPARTGQAGAMLARIIETARALRSGEKVGEQTKSRKDKVKGRKEEATGNKGRARSVESARAEGKRREQGKK